MQTESERIRQVYAGYRERGLSQGKWSEDNPGNRAILRERQTMAASMLAEGGRLPLENQEVLEVGCGSGKVLRSLVEIGAAPARCHGVDLLPDRIDAARLVLPESEFRIANAEELPYGDNAFDLVLVFTVFSSILNDQVAQSVAREIARVLRVGGGVLWYDFRFNNPANRNVRGMSRRSIIRLFPNFEFQLQSLTLLPPLARRLGPLTSMLYPALALLPFLKTHWLGLLKQGSSALWPLTVGRDSVES